MRKGFVVVAALLFACLLAPGRSSAASGPPVWAGTCNLPNAATQWMDFGWPAFSSVFGRPGVIVSASSGGFPQQMRDTGARTVYWDMHLKARVGQPATPADPSTIVAKANTLYEFASAQMGCPNPVIVENELFGASLATPWSDANATYRQNVLTFLRQLSARGAYPMLLVNSTPYTDGDAAVWWQQVAAVSDLVRETYVPATILWKQGAIVANRTLRNKYRSAVQQLTDIGVPPQRIGLIVTMSTTVGFGGRNGLQPASAWYDVVKWQALSLRQVAAETGISSLWSWGWGQYTPAESDPDKGTAACVWLWARNPSLCDGPAVAGLDFSTSRTEGQIRIRAGLQCSVGRDSLSNDAIQRLQLVTGDRDTAYTALYSRLVEARDTPVSTKRALAAEQAVVASRFQGNRSAYVAALSAAHANRAIALGILSDELRRAEIESTLPAGRPSEADIATFYSSYPDLLVRKVTSREPVPWLDGLKRGYALSQIAPAELFTAKAGRGSLVRTPLGSYTVTPVGDAVPLGLLPLGAVRPAIAGAIRSFARGAAYERWTTIHQKDALATAICLRDDLPQPGVVDLSTYLPFLSVAGA
jgi:hypothetical protein